MSSETWLAGFGSNLVIAREHRAGMTFFTIQGQFQKAWRASGIRFAYGLVTRESVIEPHLRAGWRRIGAIPVYAKPIRFPTATASLIPDLLRPLAFLPLKGAEGAVRLYDAARSALRPRDIAVQEIADFTGLSDEFLAGIMASHEIAAVRDRETLNWRFTKNADREYRIYLARQGSREVGYMVTRSLQMKHLRTLALVDLAVEPGRAAAADALLSRCTLEARVAGADVVATILNPSSSLLPALARNGFLRTPETFALVAQVPRGTHEADVLARAYEKWHLTWFDHDYV